MRTPRLRGHRPPYQSGRRRHARAVDSRENPLERSSDRFERRLRLLLMVVLAVAVPMAAWIAGSATYSHDSRLRQVQMTERHPVTARLLSDAQDAGDLTDGTLSSHAPVRWSDVRGTHDAPAPVGAWQRKGDTVTVWLDAHGHVTTPPPTSDSAAVAGAEMGFAAAAGAALIVGGAWKGVRVRLDRRRFEQWDQEWEIVEPRWTGRRAR